MTMAARRTTWGLPVLISVVLLTGCGDPGAGLTAAPARTGAERAAAPAAPAAAKPPSRTPPRTTAEPVRPAKERPKPATTATVPRPPATAVPTRQLPDEIALPAHDGATPDVAMSGGTLVGDQRLGCVWVVQGGRRLAALWPPGYRAKFGPVRIYDEAGEVWREGQVRELGGGVSSVVDRVPEACRTGTRVLFIKALRN